MQKYENRPFALLGVDEDDSQAALKKTQEKYHLNWRSWWDDGGSIAGQWKVDRFPTLFLVDHKGVVRWSSATELNLKQMEQLLERLVKEAEKEDRKQAARSHDRQGAGLFAP